MVELDRQWLRPQPVPAASVEKKADVGVFVPSLNEYTVVFMDDKLDEVG